MSRKRSVVELSRDGWLLTAHVCRFCAARVLSDVDGVFRCSTCSAVSRFAIEDICGCGMHLGPPAKSTRDRDRKQTRAPQGWRCVANPKLTTASPALLVIAYLDTPSPAAAKLTRANEA